MPQQALIVVSNLSIKQRNIILDDLKHIKCSMRHQKNIETEITKMFDKVHTMFHDRKYDCQWIER